MVDNKDSLICFVIMPFGEYFDDYYESIYVPAIEAANLKPIRGDSIFNPGSIVEQIWDFTQKADVLLADLTGHNPNVFYELGLAHAISKPVVLLTDNINLVPFDLKALRVIAYDKNLVNWAKLLQENITKALLETLENPIRAVPLPFRQGLKEVPETTSFVNDRERDLLISFILMVLDGSKSEDLQDLIETIKNEYTIHFGSDFTKQAFKTAEEIGFDAVKINHFFKQRLGYDVEIENEKFPRRYFMEVDPIISEMGFSMSRDFE